MRVAWIAAALMTTIAAPAPGQTVAALSAGQVRVELDAHLRTRIVAILGSEEIVVGPFTASESVSAGATEIDDFAFEGRSEERIEDRLGAGRRLTVTGRSKNPSIGKAVSISVYDAFPRVAVVQARYTNAGASALSLDQWTANRHAIVAAGGSRRPAFWSYQSGSYESRPDWVLPLRKGFTQENYQGMNASDYGAAPRSWTYGAGTSGSRSDTSRPHRAWSRCPWPWRAPPRPRWRSGRGAGGRSTRERASTLSGPSWPSTAATTSRRSWTTEA